MNKYLTICRYIIYSCFNIIADAKFKENSNSLDKISNNFKS